MQSIQRLVTILRLEDAVACLAEDAIGDPAGIPLVVDNQDSRGRTGEWGRQLEIPGSGYLSIGP